MTQGDIDTVVDAFRQAAIRAKDAGFDGVQLHGAHCYLFSQFLSPFFNKRMDGYGGSVENRARIVVDTYNAVRNEVGADYPIMIKMNVTDFLDDGISIDEAVQAASIYTKTGIDAIENTVTMGDGDALLSRCLTADRANFLVDPPGRTFRADVKIRYLHKAAPAGIEELGGGKVRVVFDKPQRAITPGQAVVFYDGEVVLGGAWIEQAGPHIESRTP